MENPIKLGWCGGPPIPGNLHIWNKKAAMAQSQRCCSRHGAACHMSMPYTFPAKCVLLFVLIAFHCHMLSGLCPTLYIFSPPLCCNTFSIEVIPIEAMEPVNPDSPATQAPPVQEPSSFYIDDYLFATYHRDSHSWRTCTTLTRTRGQLQSATLRTPDLAKQSSSNTLTFGTG